MKNKFRLIFWITFLCLGFSCSSLISIFPHHEETNQEFEKYLTKVPINYGDLVVGFKKANGFFDVFHENQTNSTISGFCGFSLFYPHFQISINPEWWKDKTDKQRIAILIHEIGHCKYNSLHDDDKFQLGCPKTLMNTFTISNSCLEMFWGYYMWEIEERFNGN